ncbi:MAG TPA: hypothetical protein VLC98_07665 [Phnomibacter sp.]|nr:hypothetical protein [Phnomibacter sp.]
MSDTRIEFKDVQLPGILLADLYKSHLVLVEGEHISSSTAGSARKLEKAPAPVEPKPEKPKNIILPPAPPAPAPAPAPAEIPAPVAEQPAELSLAPHAFLGAFKKQVLILLNDPKAVHIGEDNLAFLSKIIASVGVSLEHIALLNTYGKKVDYHSLKAQFPATVAIYFGIEPAAIGVPMKFPPFQVQVWDECSFLIAPALEALNGSSAQQTEMKKQLWAALKKIFS